MNFTQHKLLPALLTGMSLWAFNAQTLAATNTPTYTNTLQTLQQDIETVMEQNGIVGLSIALVDDQKVVWAEGFGYADKAKNLKALPETIYRVGSISKLFTATAAMQLVEQGKLDIDKPLQTYVPELAIKTRFPEAGPITSRQVMTHHSGLPSAYLKNFRAASPVESFNQLVDKLPDEYTAYPPNLTLSYSNLAVSLLGTAIENTCSVTFSLCLEQNLLQPLGMSNTEFAQDASVSALMSKEYSQGVPVPVPATYMRDVPAGGLNSNVLDLSRFMNMVFADGKIEGKSIISAATLSEMLRQQNADIPLDLDNKIGLAWFFDQTKTGETIASHSGAIGEFHSHLATIPAHKLGVVVLANTDSASDVVGDIATAALNLMQSEKSAAAGLVQTTHASAVTIPINPYTLPGYYASPFGLLSIHNSHGRMYIKIDGKSYPLNLQTDGSAKFLSPLSGTEVTLRRDKLSEHQVLIADSFETGRQLLGEKLAQPQLSKIWRKRLGNYQVSNKGDDVGLQAKRPNISIKNGFLVLNMEGSDLVLTPVNDSEAIIAGLGRGLGETLTFETHGKQQTVRYSGYLAQRVAR